MSKDNATLGKSKNTVKWSFRSFQYVNQILNCFFKSVYTIVQFCFLFLLVTPCVKPKPRFEMSIMGWQKSLHLLDRRLLAFERCINYLKIYNFSKYESEVSHLVLHYSFIRIVAMQAEHFKFTAF